MLSRKSLVVIPERSKYPASAPPVPRSENPLRVREVECLTAPALNAMGDHALNFITDTRAMLDSVGHHITIRGRKVLALALKDYLAPDPARPGSQVVVMTDAQWREWERTRRLFLGARALVTGQMGTRT